MEVMNRSVEGDRLFFNIWVTTSCNYACTYCYEGDEKKALYLNTETADQLVKFITEIAKAKETDSLWINFHGGEPTLNFQMIEYIIDSMKKRTSMELYTSMTTNCSSFNEKAVSMLKEISVSIDGNKMTHDRKRRLKNGQGTFDVSFKNALKYLSRHPKVRLKMVVTAADAHELYDNIIFLVKHGFKMIVPDIDLFDPNWNEELFDLIFTQLKRVKEYLCAQRIEDVQIGIIDQPLTRKGKCAIGKESYQIYPNGELYPCAYVVGFSKYCIGDVKMGIDKEKVCQLNGLMSAEVSECNGCHYYECCTTYRCYFLNEKLTGSLYTPSEVVCATEHLKLKLKKI